MTDPDGMKAKGIEYQNVTFTVQASRLAEYEKEDLAEVNSGALMNQCCQTSRDATRVASTVSTMQHKFKVNNGLAHFNITPRDQGTIQSYPPKADVNYQDVGLPTTSLATVNNAVQTYGVVSGVSEAGALYNSLKGVLSIRNSVPGMLARVVPTADVSATLGVPSASQVFVTAANDIRGLNAAQIAEKLTIKESSSGFTIFEFPTPKGISTPIVSESTGFVGGGRTLGGAREFNIPNQIIPPNSIIRTVRP